MRRTGYITREKMNLIYDMVSKDNYDWWYIGDCKPTELSEHYHDKIIAIENINQVNSNDFYFIRETDKRNQNLKTISQQYGHFERSVEDDLDDFFQKLQQRSISDEIVSSFFLPKLTAEELRLLESRDQEFLAVYNYSSYDSSRRTYELNEHT